MAYKHQHANSTLININSVLATPSTCTSSSIDSYSSFSEIYFLASIRQNIKAACIISIIHTLFDITHYAQQSELENKYTLYNRAEAFAFNTKQTKSGCNKQT